MFGIKRETKAANVQAVSETAGVYEISKGVSKKELEKLSNNPKTKLIQFVKPLDENEIILLEAVIFSKRPDISLRVYGHYGEECDLAFIEQIPSLRKLSVDCLMNAKGIEKVTTLKNLDELGIGVFNLDNFDFLKTINANLKRLSLHQTRSNKPSIASIKRLSDLNVLYLEGQQNGIEEIRNLRKLEEITLRSISTPNIDYLAGLPDLWSVDIKLGGIKNFDGLTSLPKLKYLELWQVRGLNDLSFISELTTLQNLFIQSVKQVGKLPDFSNSTALRRIYLENLKGLTCLSTLKSAPALEEFAFVMAGNLEPEQLIPVLENPSLKSVGCGFGSVKKNDKFNNLVSAYKKDPYSFRKFNYE